MGRISENEERKSRLNPIWLILAALTVAAQWNEALGVLRLLAEFCRSWLDFWREAWRRLFELIEPYVLQTYPPDTHDMLTLIGTLLATVGIGQIVTAIGKDERPMKTYDEVQRLFKTPDFLTAGITIVTVTASLAMIILPFFQAITSTAVGAEALAGPGQTQYWFEVPNGRWIGILAAITTLAVAILLAVFVEPIRKFMPIAAITVAVIFLLMIGSVDFRSFWSIMTHRVELLGVSASLVTGTVFGLAILLPVFYRQQARQWSEMQEHGWTWGALLRWLPVALYLSFFALAPVIFLFVPPGFQQFTAPIVLWYGFCATLGLIAMRSALPLVQLAMIVLGILAIDAVATGALDVWNTIHT